MPLDMPTIVERLTRQFTRDVERFSDRRLTAIERKVIQLCAESMASSIIAARLKEDER